jgi:hypothetical protein
VLQASAERLQFADDMFDAALAQLVVHFMADPVAGLTEMARVTRPDGVVAACVWDHAGGQGPLGVFWRPRARSTPKSTTNHGSRARARDTWANCSSQPGSARSRRRSSRPRSSTRASRSGGSRSPAASGLQAPTSRASTRGGRSSCARRAVVCCPPPRLCSRLRRGRRADSRRHPLGAGWSRRWGLNR